MRAFAEFAVKKTCALLNVGSPTGFTSEAVELLENEFKALNIPTIRTRKGSLLADFGGNDSCEGGLLLEAHLDTLGGMVAQIKSNGRLQLTNLGGMNPNNAETENAVVVTRKGARIEGCFQLINPSIHVNGKYNEIKRGWDTMELVLDEDVNCESEVRALGINVGDFVLFDPRTRVTQSGYIKSRFLDDKLSVGILLGLAKYLKDNDKIPDRHVWAHVTTFEEVGHGGSASVPDGVTEAISVDMGCVGEGLSCTERTVSICAKDSHGPYNRETTLALIDAAERGGTDYRVDIYPFYGSDVEATLSAGYDLRHGLIGAGVYASHGYERSHIDGVENTLKLLAAYICK